MNVVLRRAGAKDEYLQGPNAWTEQSWLASTFSPAEAKRIGATLTIETVAIPLNSLWWWA